MDLGNSISTLGMLTIVLGGGIVPTTRPPEADFAIKIDFNRGEKHPERIFKAAEEVISAFQSLDRSLITAIDSKIEPILVLEDVEAGSVKVWLRNVLEAVDDDALKGLEWKKQIGKYLVRSKYICIDFLNKRIALEDRTKESDQRALVDLRKKLRAEAEKTDVKHIPDYYEVPTSDLLQHLSRISQAKNLLSDKDELSYITDDEEVKFSAGMGWSPEEMVDLYVKETITNPPQEMILLVKKPDYIGKSRWEFRYGKHPIFATIGDEKWLTSFQARKVDVRPGDALKCRVTIEVKYGYDDDVLSETHTVEQVLEVKENRAVQYDFIKDENKPKKGS